jgi:hypothetical protein
LVGLNRRPREAAARSVQSPGVAGHTEGLSIMARLRLARLLAAATATDASERMYVRQQRQEGRGVGDGVRLSEREQALKGITP